MSDNNIAEWNMWSNNFERLKIFPFDRHSSLDHLTDSQDIISPPKTDKPLLQCLHLILVSLKLDGLMPSIETLRHTNDYLDEIKAYGKPIRRLKDDAVPLLNILWRLKAFFLKHFPSEILSNQDPQRSASQQNQNQNGEEIIQMTVVILKKLIPENVKSLMKLIDNLARMFKGCNK